MTTSVFIVGVSIIFTFAQGQPESPMEHSFLESGGSSRFPAGLQAGSHQGREQERHRLEQSLEIWDSPADAQHLGVPGSQGWAPRAAQGVRRDGSSRGEMQPLQPQPSSSHRQQHPQTAMPQQTLMSTFSSCPLR